MSKSTRGTKTPKTAKPSKGTTTAKAATKAKRATREAPAEVPRAPKPAQPKKARAKASRRVVEAEALPHLDGRGNARMVDVGAKPSTQRIAVAEAFVRMRPDTLRLLSEQALAKGDALAVARIAGIMAAKKTSDFIPLAHPLLLTHVAVELEPRPDDGGVRIETRVETTSPTGVEMEALTAATAAALSIYDMAKKHDREMVIERVQLLVKTGGQSGRFVREDPEVTTPRKHRGARR